MGTTWDYKTKPQTVGDTDFLALGPLDLGWEHVLTSALGQRLLRACLGLSLGLARSRAPCAHGTERVCRVFLPQGLRKELNSASSGICERMYLCFCCLCRMVLEAWLLLSLRTSVSFELTGLFASRYTQTLTRFFLNVLIIFWWSQRICKWILNGCQLFSF